MKKALSILAAVAVLAPAVSAPASDHLVSRGAVDEALSAASESRAQDLARVERVLSRPEAASASALVNVDLASVRAAFASLDDGELRDLAARADALDADPVAGMLDPTIRQLLIIFLIVAIVILVLRAID